MVRGNFLINLIVAGLFFAIFSPNVFAVTPTPTPLVAGYWQTIDGKTHKPSSIIEIQPQGKFYIGKISKTYSGKKDRCVACKGDQKDKPIIGLTIIKDMICKPTHCSHGTILDPRDGQVYHATLQLANNGQKLKVRGYVGIPAFGKTVIWHRVASNK